MTEGLKRCTKCGEEKPIGEFRLGGVRENGKRYRASTCKPCHAENALAYRNANLAKVRARELDYARRHAEQKRANARRWYAENGERARKRINAAYLEHPEYNRDMAHKSRAKKAGAPVLEFVRRREVYDRDQGICHVCGEAVPWDDYEMDHVVPLSQGGEHSYANAKTSHTACNRTREIERRRVAETGV